MERYHRRSIAKHWAFFGVLPLGCFIYWISQSYFRQFPIPVPDPGNQRAAALAASILLAKGGALLSMIPALWLDVFLLKPRNILRDFGAMAYITFESRRIHLNLLAIISILILIIGSFLGHLDLAAAASVIFAITIVTSTLIFWLPAACIVLGMSGKSQEVLNYVSRFLSPLRVVSLFRYQGWDMYADRNSNMRTISPDRWRRVVFLFIKICPIIIVDARFKSDYLDLEIEYIRDNGWLKKTIFICDNNGNAAALTRFRSTEQGEWRICRIGDLWLEF